MDQRRSDIAAVIITLNEEENVRACLEALSKVISEIIVLDSHSTDNTVKIAASFGAIVHSMDWLGYAQTKNKGNQLAKADWILSIDADEVLSPALIQSLAGLSLNEGTVYSLDRLTNFAGYWIRHSGWYPDWKPRLFHKKEVCWSGDYVHETLLIPATFNKVRLKGKLWHYSYKSLEDHAVRAEKYCRLAAQKMFAAGKKAGPVKRWLAPPVRFIRTFLLKGGILDGYPGLIISVRDAKQVFRKYQLLDEMQRFQKEKTG